LQPQGEQKQQGEQLTSPTPTRGIGRVGHPQGATKSTAMCNLTSAACARWMRTTLTQL
jgi:hypothetical protein